MPYKPSYLMQQMARGRPMPIGSPERDLDAAIDRLSPMDMEAAIHHGAHPSGQALHRLFDRCLGPHQQLSIPMDRLMSCCRALGRANVAWSTPDPRTGFTAARRAAELATHPQALAWYLFLRGQTCQRWDQPEGPDRHSLIEVWHAKASETLRAHLPPVPARDSSGPSRPRPR